ncbi:MAG: hypothetical protein AABY22_12495 [Nanoarchaeota archaeon]
MSQKESQFHLESESQLTRLAANFFQKKTDGEYSANDVAVVKEFFYHTLQSKPLKKYKVALCFICINPDYWQYMPKAIGGAKQFLLPDHRIDYFIWSDLPDNLDIVKQKIAESFLKTGEAKASVINASSAAILMDNNKVIDLDNLVRDLSKIKKEHNIFLIEPVEWPLPTLFRYHTFLQQEEKLSEYDYIFYCDIDMIFNNYIGDEIFGEGLTAALHPMYALRHNFNAPFEPNPNSAAYVPFYNTYYAGGFQGGKSADFIKAMKAMRRTIDLDFENNNYIARWNDESHWNKYLRDNPPSITLSPAYIYPDSLINEYYIKVWGRNYSPKLITLTKKFTVNKEGASAIQEQLKTL